MAKIVIPSSGESVVEADIVNWLKKDGESVKENDPILEIETEKASLTVAAPASGVLKIDIKSGTVKVGQEVGSVSGSASSAAEKTPVAPPAEKAVINTAPTPTVPTATPSPYAAGFPSPAAAKAAANTGVDLAAIQGSGKDGRITKSDVQSATAETVATSPTKAAQPGDRSETREKMTRLRQTIARRLVESQHTAALLTTFNEVDMKAVMDIRNKYKDKFVEANGIKLGIMSFFTKAVCAALQKFPVVNAAIQDTDIVYHNYCDIGIAVSTPKGLIVPVIRNAESLSMAETEHKIAEFGKKGKDGTIGPDELMGGTFTITNGGIFGSMLSTPIVNPPQSAILGLHNIVNRPVAINNAVEIRPIMYVALSYDHRLIDGAQAVRFLVAVKEYIEDPTSLLINI